jgi:hypothetical protein
LLYRPHLLDSRRQEDETVHSRSLTYRSVAPSLVLLVAFVSPARAQQFTGTIQGVVQDATSRRTITRLRAPM